MRNDIRPESEHRERSMECDPGGLSVLGYPILSEYEYEQGSRGAGSREPGAGGQRAKSREQRAGNRGQGVAERI